MYIITMSSTYALNLNFIPPNSLTVWIQFGMYLQRMDRWALHVCYPGHTQASIIELYSYTQFVLRFRILYFMSKLSFRDISRPSSHPATCGVYESCNIYYNVPEDCEDVELNTCDWRYVHKNLKCSLILKSN